MWDAISKASLYVTGTRAQLDAMASEYNKETPKFCLRYLANGFDVHALTTQQQAEFAKTLQKLTGFTGRN